MDTTEQMSAIGATDENIPCFIRKTYKILEDDNYSDFISWNDEGTAIIIKNPTEFAQNVLPIYFKHNNLNSFIRQLNMYDFHKKKTPDGEHVYYHELFQRDKKHLLKSIKRKNAESSALNNEKSRLGQELVRTKQDIATIINENLLLKKLNRENLATISNLEAKVGEINLQNQALWNQLVKLNEKEELMRAFVPNINVNLKRENPNYPLSTLDMNTGKVTALPSANKLAQTTTRIPGFASDTSNQRNWNLLGENFQDVNIPGYYNSVNENMLQSHDDRRKLGARSELVGKAYQDSGLNHEISQQVVRNMEQELQYLKKLTSSNTRPTSGLNTVAESPDSLLGKRRVDNDAGQLGLGCGGFEGFNKFYKTDMSSLGFMPNIYKPEGDDILMNYDQLQL